MIAARQIAFGKAAGRLPTARDYIQDGLVAMWDGIENAGWGIHDATATMWTDLIRNGVGIGLINASYCTSSFTDNAMRIVGNRGFSTNVGPVLDSVNLTYELVFAVPVFNGFVEDFPLSYGTVFRLSNYTYRLLLRPSRRNITVYTSGVGECNSEIFPPSQPASITVAQTKASHIVNKNGEQIIAYSDTHDLGLSSSIMGFAYAASTPQWAGGTTFDFHALRIYARTLTQAEIAANAKIDQARFGI